MNGQSSTIPAYLAAGTAGLTRGTSLLGHGDPRLSSFADVEARHRAERLLAAAEHDRLLRGLRRQRRATRAADRAARAADRATRTATRTAGKAAARAAKRSGRSARQHGKVMSGWTAWSSPAPAHRSSAEPQSSSVCGS